MADYYDSAGRYHYLSDEYANIEPGTEMIIKHTTGGWRNSETLYSDITRVSRVSSVSFWLDNPYDTNDKEIRFKKSDGDRHGTYGYRYKALFATPENVKLMKSAHRKRKNDAARAKAEAEDKEDMLRARYGASHIEDKEVQKILGKVRSLAEDGRAMLERYFADNKGASVEKPWIAINNNKDYDLERLQAGATLHEYASELHTELVGLVNAFESGTVFYQKGGIRRYSPCPDDPEDHSVTCCVMLFDHIKYTAAREMERILDRDEFKPGEAEYIKKLRHIGGDRYNYHRVVEEKKEEAA